jgi:hypothetical protein
MSRPDSSCLSAHFVDQETRRIVCLRQKYHISSLCQASPLWDSAGSLMLYRVTLDFEPFAGTSSVADIGPLPSPFSQIGFDFTFNEGGTPDSPAGFFFIGAEAPCVSPCASIGTAAYFDFNAGMRLWYRHRSSHWHWESLPRVNQIPCVAFFRSVSSIN